MKLQFYIFLSLLIQTSLAGQISDGELFFTYEIESKIANENLSMSRAAYLYSLIGDYSNSIRNSDIQVSWGLDSVDICKFEIKSALNEIIRIAKNRKIVIISESHVKPQHRIFAKKIIDSLSYHGFKTLCLETLTTDIDQLNFLEDTLLMTRKFALNSYRTGTYTREPQMASLVRSSIEHGYSLYGYERTNRIKGKDRDEIQADNINKIMKATGVKKMIILCGWHHAIESETKKNNKYYWLAKLLKDRTGIDPFTIYQDNFTEKHKENQNSSLSNIEIEEPSILTRNNKIIKFSNNVDIEVIHPLTRFINNRASWLYQTNNHVPYFVKIQNDSIEYPLFIKAFKTGEELLGVPIDIVELRHKHEKKPLILERGKYIIEITNKNKIYRKETIVK